MKLAVFGGLSSNYLALEAAILDAQRLDAQELYCLGYMGAFGPHPDRVVAMLRGALREQPAAAGVLEDDHGVLGLLVRVPLVEAPHHLRERGLVACRLLLGRPGRRRLLCGCRRSLHREEEATAGPCVAGPVLHHNVVGLSTSMPP